MGQLRGQVEGLGGQVEGLGGQAAGEEEGEETGRPSHGHHATGRFLSSVSGGDSCISDSFP